MHAPPPERYWTSASIAFLSEKLALPAGDYHQDWPYVVADPAALDAYLALFNDGSIDGDIRFTLADIIIQSFEGNWGTRWRPGG